MHIGRERVVVVAGAVIVRSAPPPSLGISAPPDPVIWDMARFYLDEFGIGAARRGRVDVRRMRLGGFGEAAELLSRAVDLIEWLWVRLPANDL